MDRLTIKIVGAEDISRALDPEASRQRVADAMEVVINDAASLLSEASPVGVYAHLQGAWLQTTGVDMSATNIVGYSDPTPTAPYAWYVIFGRAPGKMPPIDSLVSWVAKKIAPAPSKLRSVAFLVARKIGRKGMKPNDFVSPIVRANTATWGDILTRAAAPPER